MRLKRIPQNILLDFELKANDGDFFSLLNEHPAMDL